MNLRTIHLPFDVELAPVIMLSAGRFTCMYEKGNLRYISVNGKEVIRMIYSAVRDKDWDTVLYEIQNEVVKESDDGFTITYTAFYQLNEIRYKASFVIEGQENKISFWMKGEALSSFLSNRIGICVLHPINEMAGVLVVITQPDGKKYQSSFPVLISPHQPFKQVKEMKWWNGEDVKVLVKLEGDVFETEDQRNWTDASYKTYSRPNELPFPYSVVAGDIIEQKVIVELSMDAKTEGKVVTVSPSSTESKIPFPKLGYSRPKGFNALTQTEINLLSNVTFDHYRVEIYLNEKHWMQELGLAFSEAKQLEAKLELIIFFTEDVDGELSILIERLQNDEAYISSILVLQQAQNVTRAPVIEKVYPVLKYAIPNVKIGYGTNGFFADLNRNSPVTGDYDFISYSINPQVHAFDTRSLIENLSAQVDTITTAKSFVGDKSIHISPVTFTIRDNENQAKGIDGRLHTSFGAAWTIQTIKNLGEAACITLYETIGPKGIIRENETADVEQETKSILTPLYEVIVAIKSFGPKYIVRKNIKSEDDDQVVLENLEGDRLIIHCEGFTNAVKSSLP